MEVTLLYEKSEDFDFINSLNNEFNLNLTFDLSDFTNCDKLDNKTLKKSIINNPNTPLLFFYKDSLVWATVENNELIKVSADWQSYQSRIVKAGKNSELLLKISKLNREMRVIDGTAGFGIDGLILASTGANVTLIEQNPILFLLLKTEQRKMCQNKNWQKLMNRIHIMYGDSSNILKNIDKADLIYLDPMFPNDSYKGAVNKNMQILHDIVAPPTLDDEQNLLKNANNALNENGKIIIKRPKSAPFFANISPIDSMANDVIRFDEYH